MEDTPKGSRPEGDHASGMVEESRPTNREVGNIILKSVDKLPTLFRMRFMIVGFADKRTEMLAEAREVKGLPPSLQNRAFNKLTQISAATSIEFLRIPPSNHLKKLSGKLAGFWSIRVNDQWRIIFRWIDGNAADVEFTDYH